MRSAARLEEIENCGVFYCLFASLDRISIACNDVPKTGEIKTNILSKPLVDPFAVKRVNSFRTFLTSGNQSIGYQDSQCDEHRPFPSTTRRLACAKKL